MLRVLLSDPAFTTMIGTGQPWVDYWYDFAAFGDLHAGQEAGVVMVFGHPVSYEGLAATGTDPCEGRYYDEGRIDPSESCLKEPRVFGSERVSFQDARVIHAFVDVERGVVFNAFQDETSPDIVEDMIRYFSARPVPPQWGLRLR